MKGKVGIGLIGAGRAGMIHARNMSFHIRQARMRTVPVWRQKSLGVNMIRIIEPC